MDQYEKNLSKINKMETQGKFKKNRDMYRSLEGENIGKIRNLKKHYENQSGTSSQKFLQAIAYNLIKNPQEGKDILSGLEIYYKYGKTKKAIASAIKATEKLTKSNPSLELNKEYYKKLRGYLKEAYEKK